MEGRRFDPAPGHRHRRSPTCTEGPGTESRAGAFFVDEQSGQLLVWRYWALSGTMQPSATRGYVAGWHEHERLALAEQVIDVLRSGLLPH